MNGKMYFSCEILGSQTVHDFDDQKIEDEEDNAKNNSNC